MSIQPHWKVPDGYSVVSRGNDIAREALNSGGGDSRALLEVTAYQCALLETLVEKVNQIDGAALQACNELGKMVQVTHERVEEVKKVVTDVMHRRRKWGDEP